VYLVADVVATGLRELTALILLLGEADLLEDEVGDGVGEGGGDGEGGGLGLVSSVGVSDEFQLEWSTIGVGEADDALLLDGTVVARTDAGLGADDAVAGFDVEAVAARLVGVDDIGAEDLNDIEVVGFWQSGGEANQSKNHEHLHVDGCVGVLL